MSRRPRVVVLDYGSGNLRSAQRALLRAGADAEITADQQAAGDADGLVVPGVGAFAACMAGLWGVGGDQVIAKRLGGSRPVLGICVGMQALFAAGVEHGERTDGCGCWPGVVDRLTAPILPHMGWNSVRPPPRTLLLAGMGAGPMFYFVHSYAARTAPPGSAWAGNAAAGAGDAAAASARNAAGAGSAGAGAGAAGEPLVTWATHGESFVAAIEDGPLTATQFHPEKSGDAGAVLLANWLETLR